MPDLVYNVKFNIEDPSKKAKATGTETVVSGYNQASEAAENFGNQAVQANAKASKSAKKAAQDTASLASAQNQLQQGAKRMNSSFSSTNQVLFSFSDGIQDASQFSYSFATGMRAVGNNIGFTAELFGNLSNKIKEYNTANAAAIASGQKMAKTMKSELVGALKGPGGIILALNIALTAITMISRAMEVNKKKTEEAKGSIDEYAAAMRNLRNIADPTEGIRQQTEAEIRNLTLALDLARRLEESSKDLAKSEDDLARARKSSGQYISRDIAALEDQVKVNNTAVDGLKRFIGQLTDVEPSVSKLEGALNTANYVLKTLNGEVERTGAITKAEIVDRFQGDAFRAVQSFKAGITDLYQAQRDGQRGIAGIVGALDSQIMQWQDLAKAGQTDLIPVINELISLRDDLMKDVGLTLKVNEIEYDDISDTIEEDMMEMFDDIHKTELDSLIESRKAIEEQQVEQHKREYDDLIEAEKKKVLTRRIYLDLTTRESAVARDTVDKINTYYDNKEIEERQKLVDQKITDEQVYSALSLAIEAERQNELTRLAENGANARKGIEELTVEQQMDLYMRLVSNVSSAIQAMFGENKAVAIAEAIINTYLAASKAASTYPPPFNKVAVAAEIAAGLARVATIKKTTIKSAGGGATGGGAATTSFGFTESKIQGEQTFRTPGFMPTSPMAGGMMTPKVEILADRKQLYYVVKRGEEEYRGIKAS